MFLILALTAALSIGQAEPPVDNPSPPPDTSDASPERWLLMKSLQETRIGAILDAGRVSVSGWSDMSFTASSASGSQLPMGFNYRANEFLLQQNWLRIERPVVTSDASGPSFGFRSDTILPGTDYRFTTARGLYSGQLTDNDGMPNTYGIDPVQFYGQAYFPFFAQGLDLKVGRMFCQYGAETIDAPSNVLASHSYSFIYDPFTHTGVMSTIQLNPTWSVQLGMMLGPDVFIDSAASPYCMASVKWAPPEGKSTVLVSTLFGSGRYDAAEQFNNPNIFDLVFTHAFASRFSYTLDALFGYQTDVPAIGTATWFGVVNYLTCKFTPKFSGTTRLEFFDDVDGNRTGFPGLYTAVTGGINVQPYPGVVLRPELRFDYNGESRPFDGQHGLFTACMDVILRW